MKTDEKGFRASIQARARKLDQALADEELAHRYELGQLLAKYKPKYGKQTMTQLAESCGWRSPNPMYRAKKMVQLIDRQTFNRIVAARKEDGRPLFVWDDVKRIIEVDDKDLRIKLIDEAVEKKLSGKALQSRINRLKKRAPGGRARSYADPLRTFEAAIIDVQDWRARLSRVSEGIDLLETPPMTLRKRSVRKLRMLRDEIGRMRQELLSCMRNIDRTLP